MTDRRQSRLISWQTRTICKFVSAIGQFENENPLMEHVEKIALDDDELFELGEYGPGTNSKVVNGSNLPEPKVGSYERLAMGLAGRR